MSWKNPVTFTVIGVTAAIATQPNPWPSSATPWAAAHLADRSYAHALTAFSQVPQAATDFASEIASIYAALLTAQEPMAPEVVALLASNRGDLYES